MTALILKTTIMLGLLALAGPAWSGDAIVIPGSPTTAPSKAILRVDDAGALSVWWPEGPRYRLSESLDGGENWSPMPLTTVLPDAVVAFDREGRAYCAYWEFDQGSYDLKVAASSDKGLSLPDSTVVERTWACCREYGPPFLRTGESGRAWAGSSWSDSDGSYGESYVVCQTDDGGLTWSGPSDLAEYPWIETAIAVTPWNSLESAHVNYNYYSFCPSDVEPRYFVHDRWHTVLGESIPCVGSFDYLRVQGTRDRRLLTSWIHELDFPGGSVRTLQVVDGQAPAFNSPLAIQPVFDSGRHAYAHEIKDGRLLLHRSSDLAAHYDAPRELTVGGGHIVEAVTILPDGQGRVYALWLEDVAGLGEINVSVSPDYGISWMPSPYRMDDVGKMPSDSRLLDTQLDGHRLYTAWHEDGRGILVERFDPLVASLSTSTVLPGDDLTMTLEIDETTDRGVQSLQGVLQFDGMMLTLREVRLGSLAQSAGWSWTHDVVGASLSFEMSGLQPLAGEGVILELDWTVSATAPDSDVQLGWASFSANLGLPLTIPTNGVIAVRRPAMSVTAVGPDPLTFVMNPLLSVNVQFDEELDPAQQFANLAFVLSDIRGRLDTVWRLTSQGRLRGMTRGHPVAGECLTVGIAEELRTQQGGLLAQPHVWDFFAGSSVGDLAYSPSLLHTAPDVCGVAAGDWDGDRDVDAALIRTGAFDDLIVLRGQLGSFSAESPLPLLDDPVCVVAADLDRDGDVDLVTAHGTAQAVVILRNDGTGAFGPIESIGLNATPHKLAVGDLNGDGFPELVSANAIEGNLSILDNEHGALVPRPPFAQGSGARDIALGDMNGDGALDMAASCLGWSRHSVFLNDGKGGFSEFGPGALDYQPYALALSDLDDDGDLDMATLGEQTDIYLSLKFNDGEGNLGSGVLYQNMGPSVDDVYVGDLDGDRRPDLVLGNSLEGELQLLTQIDTGGIGATRIIDPPGGTDRERDNLRLIDLDGDGTLDILGSYRSSGQVYVWNQSRIMTAVEPAGRPSRVTAFVGARPNPFNPSTELRFSLSVGGDARLLILDVAGRKIREFNFHELPAGEHRVRWDGRDHRNSAVASGVYFIQLLAEAGEDAGRVALVR